MYLWYSRLTVQASVEKHGPHCPNRPKSQLHYASSKGDEKVVEVQLHASADVALMDSHGRTAVHHAASNEYVEVIKILSETGVNASAKDIEGRTVGFLGMSNVRDLLDFLACPTPGIKRTREPRNQGYWSPGIIKTRDKKAKELGD